MDAKQMRNLAHQGNHECAPKDWRDVPIVTNDYDLDATLMHRDNPNLPARLSLYVKHVVKPYGPITAYRGYHGYGGDS